MACSMLSGVEDIARVQQRVSIRLLFWSLPSVVFGALGLPFGGPLVQGIALQALIWGGIDAALALSGLLVAARRRRRYPDEDQQVRDTLRLRRTLLVNGGLDVLYIAAGVAMIVLLRSDLFLLGNGIGVTIQGAFLLVFDFLHGLRLPGQAPTWYSPQP